MQYRLLPVFIKVVNYMLKQYVLGIDVGTSGCKSIIVDDSANVVGSETSGLDIISEKQGYSEQEPISWWNAVKISISKLKKNHYEVFNDIKAIGLSAQMHGLVALDKDMNVLRRSILWNDQRTEEQCAAVYDIVGGGG